MTEIICKIEGKKIIGENEYYDIREIETNIKHIIPTYQLNSLKIEYNKEYKFEKRYDRYSDKYFLDVIKNVIELKILRFDSFLNKNQVKKNSIVVDFEGKEISVAAFNWQTEKTFKNSHLRCTLERFSRNGKPIIKNRDYRHPIYKINNKYEFTVLSVNQKQLSKGTIDIFKLKGEDGCVYEVPLAPGQKQKKIKKVKCKIMCIEHVVKLMQIDFNDPFFSKIEEIVDDTTLIKKYFNPIFSSDTIEPNELKLIKQYEAGEAFWVFTFTNKILNYKFHNTINRLAYKEAVKINDLIILFEEWILKRGILTSIKDELLKQRTLKKAKAQLKLSQTKREILNNIIDHRNDSLIKLLNSEKLDTLRLYLLIQLIDKKLITDSILHQIIIKLIKNNAFKEDEYYSKHLQTIISRTKKEFLNENDIENFNLITRKLSKKEKDTNKRYLNWAYFEYLIDEHLENNPAKNICASQIIKGLSLNETSYEIRQNLLLKSYFYLENFKEKLDNPFIFNDSIELLDFKFNSQLENSKTEIIWEEIKNSKNNKTPLKVTLINKYKSGFDVIYKNIKGFLPLHHVHDKAIKYLGNVACDIETNVICISFDPTFKYFIAEQLNPESPNYFSINKRFYEIKKGEILEGEIKAIQRYGLFIKTEFNEGLLHVSDIFHFYWNINDISEYFTVGQKIKVYVTEIKDDNKISFSTKIFRRKDVNYYNELIEQTVSKTTEEDFETEKQTNIISLTDIVQYEKALCFEQLAIFQNNIDNKLNSFRIAKQFYSNTNNARSYLINIYTAYFEILLKLKRIINDKNLENIRSIKKEAQNIEKKIHSKTLEAFPESNKLLTFLKIIRLFNEESNESIEELYELVKVYSQNRRMKSLKTISKITLSNNLMVSEINDNQDFIFKNLNIIYEFLANGILTLVESIEDRFTREMKEKGNYLKKLIESDESQNLEFKSSLFTPLLDKNNLKKLEILKKQEQTKSIKVEIDKIIGESAKKKIIHSAFKNISAFANTKGGTLLIGVDDNKQICGIEREFPNIPGKKKNKDGYGLRIDSLIKNYFGNTCSSILTTEIVEFKDTGSVYVIKVSPSKNEIFLLKDAEGKDAEELFIRYHSSAQELKGKSIVEFVKNRNTVESIENQTT